MGETGQSWQRRFEALPEQAAAARRWTRARVELHDAEQIVGELFIALLGTVPDAITLTLSTAGTRVRITATGPVELPVSRTHGPGRHIVRALSRVSGITPDGRGLWAQLTTEGAKASEDSSSTGARRRRTAPRRRGDVRA